MLSVILQNDTWHIATQHDNKNTTSRITISKVLFKLRVNLNSIMLSVAFLNVVMLNAIMLSVVAPIG